MALLRKLNSRAKAEANTGFGANASDYGGRFVNKNGQPNIIKNGVGFFEKISWYHTMLQLPRGKFLLMLTIFYAVINLLFACIYYFLGIEHLAGITATTKANQFIEAFFFSAQTFTTVGYGRISPVGFTTSAIAALEALIGLLSFAIATGLFYGRFSRPRAYIKFSENMVLAPFKDGLAIMMRIAVYKNSNLIDAEAKLTAGLLIEENGKTTNKFFRLEMEYSKITALTLSWTIVHPINEDSPFYKFSLDDFKNIKGEILLYINAFDDMFSNTVTARTSYTLNELVIGAKFVPMYHRSTEGNGKTILDLGKINTYVEADISAAFVEAENTAN